MVFGSLAPEFIVTSVDDVNGRPCTRLIADEQNRKLGVTPAQEEAMKIGSMCGWDVPGADPDNCEDIVQRRGGMELG